MWKMFSSVLSFYTKLLGFQHLYSEIERNLKMLDGVNSVEYVGGFCLNYMQVNLLACHQSNGKILVP